MDDEGTLRSWKEETREQWNANPCGQVYADRTFEIDSLEFFDSVNQKRAELSDPWIAKAIPFSSGKEKKVLEIGFGMGSDLLNWANHGADCYGIDITPEHYRLATLNFALHKKQAQLKLADASDIPFPSQYFDIVYSNGVLHHTPDTVRSISEAYRVLRPGGRFIFTMYRTYSAFHLVAKILVEGLLQGKLRKLGYRGLMATVEYGADGVIRKPLVKTYSRKQLKHILEDFSKVEFKVAYFKREHLLRFGKWMPRFLEKWLERWLGWYLIVYATK